MILRFNRRSYHPVIHQIDLSQQLRLQLRVSFFQLRRPFQRRPRRLNGLMAGVGLPSPDDGRVHAIEFRDELQLRPQYRRPRISPSLY